MNILLINHYAGSPKLGMEFRPYYLGKEWLERGHQVTVVAASISHVRQQNPAIERSFTEENIHGIRYIWLRTPDYSGNGVKRALNILAFATKLWWQARRLANQTRPDVVIASSTHPLDIFGAKKIARLTNAKLVFELHDIWPLTLIEVGGMARWHPFVQLLAAGERKAYRDSDLVVSILPHAWQHAESRGAAKARYVHIPNGFALSDWSTAPAPLPENVRAHIDAAQNAGRLILGYAGSHGSANALDVLVQAMAELGDVPITAICFGGGPKRDELIRLAEQTGARCHFVGPIPKDAIPSALAACDMLYMGLMPLPIFRFGVSPNKLFDYMMAAKPVIHATTAIEEPIGKAGAGLTIPSGNPARLSEAIRQMASLSPEERAEMGRKGRDYALAHHDYSVLARTFETAMGAC